MTLVKFTNGQKYGALKSPFTDILNSLVNQDSYIPNSIVSREPAINIAESESEFIIELAAPGLRKEDFKIAVEKEQLTINADRRDDLAEVPDTKKYTRKEFNYSSFSRTFTLPESADQANIQAEYIDGILFVKIMKREESKIQIREISVK